MHQLAKLFSFTNVKEFKSGFTDGNKVNTIQYAAHLNFYRSLSFGLFLFMVHHVIFVLNLRPHHPFLSSDAYCPSSPVLYTLSIFFFLSLVLSFSLRLSCEQTEGERESERERERCESRPICPDT